MNRDPWLQLHLQLKSVCLLESIDPDVSEINSWGILIFRSFLYRVETRQYQSDSSILSTFGVRRQKCLFRQYAQQRSYCKVFSLPFLEQFLRQEHFLYECRWYHWFMWQNLWFFFRVWRIYLKDIYLISLRLIFLLKVIHLRFLQIHSPEKLLGFDFL